MSIMAEYSQRLLNAVSSAATTATQQISGYMLKSLSAVATASTGGGAGTLKIQVANVPNPLLHGLQGVVPTASWVDMPAYGAITTSVTMAAGAAVSLQAPWPLLAHRWYRFVFTGTGTGNITLDVAGLSV